MYGVCDDILQAPPGAYSFFCSNCSIHDASRVPILDHCHLFLKGVFVSLLLHLGWDYLFDMTRGRGNTRSRCPVCATLATNNTIKYGWLAVRLPSLNDPQAILVVILQSANVSPCTIDHPYMTHRALLREIYCPFRQDLYHWEACDHQ